MSNPIKLSTEKTATLEVQSVKRMAEKIRRARGILKLNQVDFAQALETTQSNVSKWEKGSYRPSPEMAARVAKLLKTDPLSLFFLEEAGVPKEWFYGTTPEGLVPERLLLDQVSAVEAVAADLIKVKEQESRYVPLLKDAAAAGSPKAIDEDEIDQLLAIPRKWVPRGGTLYAVKVEGDSMDPILLDGYIVVIDVNQKDPKKLHERMVAAREGDGVTIKWLRRDKDVYMLVPQHVSPRHPVRVMRSDGDFSIVGEVVKWIGGPPPAKR